MHSLHNPHLIRETLPRNLVRPTPHFADRRAKHNEFAAGLRVTGPEKRAQAVAKAKETRARNKQKKAQQAQAGAESLDQAQLHNEGQPSGNQDLLVGNREGEASVNIEGQAEDLENGETTDLEEWGSEGET